MQKIKSIKDDTTTNFQEDESKADKVIIIEPYENTLQAKNLERFAIFKTSSDQSE